MSSRAAPSPIAFTATERALIRPEMSQHVGQYPGLAHGIFLRTWRGTQKHQPRSRPRSAA